MAEDCVSAIVPEAVSLTVNFLYQKGFLPRQYLSEALDQVKELATKTDYTAAGGQDESSEPQWGSLQAQILQRYALPSLSTTKRRLLPGGSFEKLLLPAIPVLLRQKKRQISNTNTLDSENEGDMGSSDGVGVFKAGVILISNHIRRDMESSLTFNSIMSGVRGSDQWKSSTKSDDKERLFRETDIAVSAGSALLFAAYGFEGVPMQPGQIYSLLDATRKSLYEASAILLPKELKLLFQLLCILCGE